MTVSSNLSGADLGLVNSLARRYTSGSDPTGLDQVAELLALCLTPDEEFSIRWWWNEGCRDYADSMQLEKLNAELLTRRAELYPETI